MISLIAAVGKNNELGKGNVLVWRRPNDQKFFRDTTLGHPIIMGRKTFESLGRALPKRRNVIITRNKDYKAEGAEVVSSLEEALDLVRDEKEEVFVIGGEEIFRQSMQIADRLYITHIDAEDSGADTFFPEIIPVVWNEISRDERKKDAEHPFDYVISIYERF